MPNKYKYRAFISYSHADEKWAAWLHKALETYRVPKHLVGHAAACGPVPERIGPIFRDREELSTATSLGDVLTRSLTDSACLIVICSPNAAASHWTNQEILTYKRLGRSHRIFCLIVDGEPGASGDPSSGDRECFPSALLYEIDADGALTSQRSEPIAADARKGKDSRQDAKLKLISGMLGVDFDMLKQRELHRHHRRMIALTTAAITGMTITSALATTAWMARNEAESQRYRAEREAETAQQTTRFMVDLFKVSDPSEALGNTITAREILDRGVERIDGELDDQPAIQATLMDTMGTVYTSLSLYGAALPLVESALRKRRSLYGDQHAEVAQSLNHLGEVLTLTARYEEAEVRLRESLAARRTLHGNASAEVADTAANLGDLLSRTGRYADAAPLIRESLDIRRGLFGDVHPDVAESLEDLGLNYHDQGDFGQAVQYLRDALAMRRAIHGEKHPDLAESINNLAWALIDLGQPAEAESLFREALAMKRQVLPDVHAELAAAMNNIAYALELRGELKSAEASYREALAMNKSVYPARHPEVAAVMSNLAFVVYAEGDTDAAIDLLRDTYDMQREVLGREHPATAGTAASLGFWLIQEGGFAEAEALLDHSLAVRRRVLGSNHPETAGTLTVMANLMLATERFDEALKFAREAKAILLQSLAEGNWRVAAAVNVEGLALAGVGDYEEAEPLLLDSLTGLEQAPIPDLAEVGRLRMAQFYSAWGRPEEAAKFQANR